MIVDEDTSAASTVVTDRMLGHIFSPLQKDWAERGLSKSHLHHLHQSIPNHMLRGEKSFKLAQVEMYIQLKAGQKQH